MRKESGLTQEQVASALDWSPSKLIRVEGGRSSITRVDLDALLTRYGVSSESSRDRLQALNRGARERPWWSEYRESLNPTVLGFFGYEAGAAYIRSFQSAIIPGLLQTPQYAEVLTSHSTDAVRLGMILQSRQRRQAELAKRDNPPRQYYVLDEAVVRRHVGIKQDPAIMPAQLRRIAELAEGSDLVTVRVVPFSVGAHVGLSGPFTVLEFEGGLLGDVVYLENGRRNELVTGADERIAEYTDDFEDLLENSLSGDDSVEFIRAVADEML